MERDSAVQRRAIIFHGTGGHPEYCWYPWLGQQLAGRGYAVDIPHYPGLNVEPIATFLPKVLANHGFDEHTVLVGAGRSVVGRGSGDVVATRGGGPAHDAGCDLFQVPSFGLLAAMVMTAQRGQVAFTRAATVVVGDGVVQVAAGGRAAAAGGRAGGGAGPDQVLQPLSGLVAELLGAVVAAVAGQRGDADGEIAGAGRSAGRPGPSGWA